MLVEFVPSQELSSLVGWQVALKYLRIKQLASPETCHPSWDGEGKALGRMGTITAASAGSFGD